jgi:hypothetical protein
MWVRVLRERRFYPYGHHRVAVTYLPGMVVSVRRAWGEALVTLGDAKEVATPPRPTS